MQGKEQGGAGYLVPVCPGPAAVQVAGYQCNRARVQVPGAVLVSSAHEHHNRPDATLTTHTTHCPTPFTTTTMRPSTLHTYTHTGVTLLSCFLCYLLVFIFIFQREEQTVKPDKSGKTNSSI